MQGRKVFVRIMAAVISLATLFSVLSLTASAVGETVYDYSRPGSHHTVTMDAADVLENILGAPLPEAERNYLVSLNEEIIKYDDGITTSYVAAPYSDGTLSVFAREYTYVTESGAEVVWVPVRASLLGVERELVRGAGESYDTTFEGVPGDDDTLAVRVVYALEIEISAELANSLVNKAYNDAPLLQAEMDAATEAYEVALDEYNSAKAEYDSYLLALEQHGRDTEAFKAYLIAKRDFDAAEKKYAAYLAAKLAFESAVDARADYLEEMKIYDSLYKDYSNYLNEYKKYENAYAQYKSQADTLALCRSHLAIIDLCKVKMSALNRDLYSSVVKNSLVDMVLAERDTFESPLFKVPEKVIDLADESTEKLRVLLGDYFELTTEIAKYNYYTEYYDEFCEAFNGLFDSLHYLGQMSFMGMANGSSDAVGIPGVSEDPQRFLKYQILIAQLYLVCMAISDGPVETIDPSYLDKYQKKKVLTPENIIIGYIGDEKTLPQLIGDYTKYIKDTNNAKPITTGFPSVGEEPKPPTPVSEPKMPDYVPEPVAPTPVDDPGDPPDTVNDPGDPPKEVTEPTLPTPPTFPEETLALCASYGDTVKERKLSFDSPVTVRVESSVDKRFINVETVNVTFYDSDGTPYYTTVDRGTYADYRGPVPTKSEDERATYAFAGWQTAEGVRVDITSVNEDVKLYPYFAETLKYYTVSWEINGELKTEKLPYGALPSYVGIPTKPSTGEHRYVFTGWSPEIREVTCDTTYVAEFREMEIIPSVPGVTVIYDGDNFTFDATGSLVTDFDIAGLLELRTPFSEARIDTAFATVELSPQLLDKLEEAGVASLRIDSVTMGNAKRSYTVLALDREGREVSDLDAEVDISFSMNLQSYSRIRVRVLGADGTSTVIPYTVSGGEICFTGKPNVEYSVSSEYVTHAVSSDFASITTQNSSYFLGDTVKVNVELGEGKKLLKLFYRTQDGKETVIYNRSFVMPAEDVTVMALVEEIMCKVTFVSEGSIITTLLVPYGEIPTPPKEAPRKASDGDFEYRFIGWSPDLSAAKGNVTYKALYEAVPIEKVEAPDRLTIYELLTIIVACIFAVMLVAVVWVGIVAIKRFKR